MTQTIIDSQRYRHVFQALADCRELSPGWYFVDERGGVEGPSTTEEAADECLQAH